MPKQAIAKNSFRPASLRQTRSARTVLLRMAADQERADRIRALKQERPDLTWRRIADHVGVSERAASDWQKKGGIEYANAEKLAALFDVDVDYIWRGTESATPDVLDGPLAGDSQLDRIEQLLQTGVDRLEQIGEERRRQQEEMLGRIEALEQALIQQAEAQTTKAIAAAVKRIAAEYAARQAPAAGPEEAAPVAQGSSRRRSRQA